MARRKSPPPTLAEVTQRATTYALDVAKSTPFMLNALSDAAFGVAVHAITRAIAQAWAAGYVAAQDDRRGGR